ncbi:MAG TPA: translation initiation factor IF-2, partial [Candidatus Methanomethylia archaeon]|nr:translation initiation factor IF-2 [Candidatus Methanomethylicia archaeon]
PEHAAVLAFNVKVTPEAEAEARSHGIKIFASNIVYHVVEEYQKWVKKLQEEMKRKELSQLIWPGKIRILPGFIFRRSEPAIVGVEVLAGKIKPGYPLVREDGARVGSIMQIQDRGQSIQEATQGMKVAISIKGHIMVGRHIDEGDLLYVAVPEQHARTLVTKYRSELNTDELEVLRDLSRKFKWLLAI